MKIIQNILLVYVIASVMFTPAIMWDIIEDAMKTIKKRSPLLSMIVDMVEKTPISKTHKYQLILYFVIITGILGPFILPSILWQLLKERWNGRTNLEKFFDEEEEKEREKLNKELVTCCVVSPEPETWDDKFKIESIYDMHGNKVDNLTPDHNRAEPIEVKEYVSVIDDELIEFANFFSMHYKGMNFGDFYEGKEGYHFSYVDKLPGKARAPFGNMVTTEEKGDKMRVILSKQGIRELKPSKDFIYFSVIWGAVKLETKRQSVYVNNDIIADTIAITHCYDAGLDCTKILYDFTRFFNRNSSRIPKDRILAFTKDAAAKIEWKE